MTQREKLVELIRNAKKNTKGANCDLERDMLFADYLLENGVIVPPCKVGDTVYLLKRKCKYAGDKNEPWGACGKYWDNVYKRQNMWGCAGKDENGKQFWCEKRKMEWYVCSIAYSLIFLENENIVLGKNLFLTKEEAEKALAEKESD